MVEIAGLPERRTTTDLVFERLHEEIVSLKLLPRTKMSEAEVARRFGVSRQPVRDAFNRLGQLDLLLIRPQRATEVRGFSIERIAHARFIRLAVELEVVTHACIVWDDQKTARLQHNLDQQEHAISNSHVDEFHALDKTFHKMICELSGLPLAIKTIEECKQKVDRLCMLGLSRLSEALVLLGDHRELANALKTGEESKAREVARQHLARLDDTISEIQHTHSEYFE